MFNNRISVVNRARNGARGNSFPSSSADCNGIGNRDKPSPSFIAPLPVRCSISPIAVDGIGAMEVSDPVDEGVCVNESFFAIEDSGEIRENELLLDDGDDNDITKDLDFTSKPSPSLFSVASSTPAARLTTTEREEIIGDVFTPNVTREFDELSPQQSGAIETPMNGTYGAVSISAPAFLVPQQQPKTPHSANSGWVVAETPQTVEKFPVRPSVGSASLMANNTRRRSIASAIHELNLMSTELLQFITAFEEKYSTSKR